MTAKRSAVMLGKYTCVYAPTTATPISRGLVLGILFSPKTKTKKNNLTDWLFFRGTSTPDTHDEPGRSIPRSR